MWFPLNIHMSNRGIPINSHPGAFGDIGMGAMASIEDIVNSL